MGCHSREFTIETLKEKSYFPRLSSYLIDQLVGFSCDQLARFLWAIDAFEAGEPVTWVPKAFDSDGLLAGYSHLHYKRPDWAATNLAAAHRQPLKQSLETTIGVLAERIVDGKADLGMVLEKFSSRASSRATGDWVIYRDGSGGPQYLAVHEHTERGSAEELALKEVLDCITF